MAKKHKFLYGPVRSRRLGRSLGIDIVPFKVCTLDCIYCQLGKTTKKTIERKEYVPIAPPLAELKELLKKGLETDYITVSGCGEPTLNSQLGELIDAIKRLTDIPVAVLTNGTLFYRKDVRADCTKADLVVPSLDAADEQSFQKVNRPHNDLSFEKLVDGLSEFRSEFKGPIWLEVFLVEDFNAKKGQILKIKEAISRIRPDKVQLNTAVRPTAEPDVRAVSYEKLETIAKELGGNCEVISKKKTADKKPAPTTDEGSIITNRLLSILKRRPCTLEDICRALGISRNEAVKYIASLQDNSAVITEKRDGTIFFKSG